MKHKTKQGVRDLNSLVGKQNPRYEGVQEQFLADMAKKCFHRYMRKGQACLHCGKVQEEQL